MALSTPPSPALPHGVNAVQAVTSVANPVVPSHAVQQAALSSALLEISHAAPAQLPAAPTVASKPAPHWASETGADPGPSPSASLQVARGTQLFPDRTLSVGHSSQLRVVSVVLRGHETAQVSYAMTDTPLESIPVAQDSSQAATPGPDATNAAQS